MGEKNARGSVLGQGLHLGAEPQALVSVVMQVCRALIVLVTNAPEFHGYAVRSFYRNLHAYQVRAVRAAQSTAHTPGRRRRRHATITARRAAFLQPPANETTAARRRRQACPGRRALSRALSHAATTTRRTWRSGACW